MNLVLQTPEGWHQFNHDSHVIGKKYAPVSTDTIFIANPPGTVIGTMTLETGEKYAGVIVARRLKSDGLVDDDVKVIIHKVIRAPGSFQVLYTAIVLQEWTKLMSWAETQTHHCMVLPLAQVLLDEVEKTKTTIMVVRHVNQILFLSIAGGGISFATVSAFSEKYDDLVRAVNSLGLRIKTVLDSLPDVPNVQSTVCWGSTLTTESFSEQESSLIQILSDIIGRSIEKISLEKYASHQELVLSSALSLSQKTSWNSWTNSTQEKFKYYLKRHSTRMLSVCLIMALIGILQAAWWTTEALRVQDRSRAELQKIEQIKARLPARTMQNTKAEEIKATEKLIDAIAKIRTTIDLSDLFVTLKDASSNDVRILRFYGEMAPPNKKQNESSEHIFIEVGSGVDGEQRPLLGFLDNLRNANYEVTPIDNKESAAIGAQSTYTYKLKKVGQGKL